MYESRFGKSQSSLLIIVSLVGIFSIVWLISTFLAARGVKTTVRETELHKLSSYINLAKGFSREALLLSSHTAVQEVAGNGGEISVEGRTWICNGKDTSPSVDEVRYFLSNKTLETLQNYINSFHIEDLPTVNVTNFTCVDYDVSEKSVFSGENDELFNVAAYGSDVTVTYKDDKIESNNDIYQGVSRVRFWYMYRKFKEWVATEASLFNSCVCDCSSHACVSGPISGECSQHGSFYRCVKSCVDASLNRLRDTFSDNDIRCYAKIECCYVEVEDWCEPVYGQECLPWDNPPRCGGCQYKDAGELCSEEYIPKYGLGERESYCEGSCWVSGYVKTSVKVHFTCEDNKYLLSTRGERKLIFSVGATSSVETPCMEDKECICPAPLPGCDGDYIQDCVCPLPNPCGGDCRGYCRYERSPCPPVRSDVTMPGGGGGATPTAAPRREQEAPRIGNP